MFMPWENTMISFFKQRLYCFRILGTPKVYCFSEVDYASFLTSLPSLSVDDTTRLRGNMWRHALWLLKGVSQLNMKLNLFKRSMIFATFFGACLCIALIVGSLGTTRWVEARPRRTSNPLESTGHLNFGLFEGRKELNPKYGVRTFNISGETVNLLSMYR